jgi:hypothetical protein
MPEAVAPTMRAARIALTASTEPKFGVNRSEAVRERLLGRGCFGRYSGRSSPICVCAARSRSAKRAIEVRARARDGLGDRSATQPL